MQQTKTKYNSDTIGIVCSNEELEVISDYQKQFDKIPHHIKIDMITGLSYVCNKYWLEYRDMLCKTKIEIWHIILDKINSFNGGISK